MRALTLLTLAAALMANGACLPKDEAEPEFMRLPKGYDPKGADLTFNAERIKALNIMSEDEKDSYIQELTTKAGSYKGQAIFKSGAGLGEAMEDAQHGSYELSASTKELLFEITIDYNIFTTPELGKPLAPHAPIEFTGTLIDFDFQAEDKPRKMSIRVKADDVKRIKE
jgi:hypothetical protein